MPVPSPRNKILPARGDYTDLAAGVASIADGEICYAIDQDQYYQKEGGSLVSVGATKAQGILADSSVQPGDSITTLNNNAGYVTANQVPLANSAVQPGDGVSVLVNNSGYITASELTTLSPVTSVNYRTGDVVIRKSDVGLSEVDNTSDLDKPISTAQQAGLDVKADLVGGVVPNSQLPSFSPGNYLGAVVDEAAMLALTGAEGDWCLRTDVSTTWYITGSDPSDINDWVQVASTSSGVSSVNGETGTVVFTPEDLGAVSSTGGSFTGNVLIGGTLPSSPNIELNADGSITTEADVTINTLTIGLGGGSVLTNTALGLSALINNTTGGNNAAFGYQALLNNTIGVNNIGVGREALLGNTEGTNNTAVGRQAGYNNTTGGNNAAFGYQALLNNTTGANNTVVGRAAFLSNTEGVLNTAVGRQAGYYIEGSNNTILGAYKGTSADATLSDTVIISAGTIEKLRIDSTGGLLFGGTLPSAPNITLSVDGSITTAADATINTLTIGLGGSSVSTNTAIGLSTLASNTTGANNVAVGRNTLSANTEGSQNTAVGQAALSNNTTGGNNTAVGRSGLLSNTEGDQNTAVGQAALSLNTTGSSNTAAGYQSLQNNTIGTDNAALGREALQNNTEGIGNAAIGRSALDGNTEGDFNTAIGRSALLNNTTGSGNVGIGGRDSAGTYTPVFSTTTHSDRIVMGSTSVTNAYVQVAWTVTSDARDKTNFASVPYGLDFVNQLKPTAYQFKLDRDAEETNGGVRYGFKAQDILALEGDNPVIIDNEDPDHLKYKGEHLVPVLVNAVQELTAMVNDLQAEVQALKEAAS
jgi:hypothetical protein